MVGADDTIKAHYPFSTSQSKKLLLCDTLRAVCELCDTVPLIHHEIARLHVERAEKSNYDGKKKKKLLFRNANVIVRSARIHQHQRVRKHVVTARSNRRKT